MLTSLRLVLVVIGFAFATQSFASTDLVRLRDGVGIVGAPYRMDGTLDVNGNGRPEFIVANRLYITIVEEDPGLRGYLEVARLDAPAFSYFGGAILVDVPGADPDLLLIWSSQAELRDASTLAVKVMRLGSFGYAASGDIDGDGMPEIVVPFGGSVGVFDPTTLESRGSFQLTASSLSLADIVGDARDEIITNNARAFEVTRSGSTYSTTEVWNADVSGYSTSYVIDYQGNPAIVVRAQTGCCAQLATFRPEYSLRTLVPATGEASQLIFADANGDGSVDLITTTPSFVRAIDIATGLTLWERDTIYQLPRLGSVYQPIAFDLDGDGTAELVWADASYDSGIVANTIPLSGAPRWQSDLSQSRVADWTLMTRPGGKPSIAYLTLGSRFAPRLATVSFLDGLSLRDEGGSAFAWLPGYNGTNRWVVQYAITSSPLEGDVDAVVVAGAELSSSSVNPITRFLWTFGGDGALLSEQILQSLANPQRILAAQVLDRPERQLVIAGTMPEPASGPGLNAGRVEIVDYATGNSLWQSDLLNLSSGDPVPKLQVADLDADDEPEIILAYAGETKVFKPSEGTNFIAGYAAEQFSLLDRGVGHNFKMATLNGTTVNVYDGLSPTPEKIFVLPSTVLGLALFAQAPDDVLMFATSDYVKTTVRRYDNGEIVTSNLNYPGGPLEAIDLDGDNRVELVSGNLKIWQLENDYIFRGGFDQPAQ